MSAEGSDSMHDFQGASVELRRGTTLIEASAGTGKTYSIATLFLRLVMEQGVTVDRILAVTYTDAATKELVGRVRQRLYEAFCELERWRASGEEPSEEVLLVWLAREPGKEEVTEALRRLHQAVQLFDEAMISTIHSFCYRALQEYAFESGARYSAELLGESRALLDEVAGDFWRRRICMASPLVASLAVALGYSGLALWRELLGAAGKQARRLPEMEPVTPEAREAELAATFRDLAAMWQAEGTAACALLRGKASGVSQAEKAYREDRLQEMIAAMEAWAAEPTGAVAAETLRAIRMLSRPAITANTLKGKTPPEHPFFEACEAAVARVERFFLAMRFAFLEEAERDLEAAKRERNVLLFDDLLRHFHAALTGRGGERLARAVAGRFDAVLIDEFQDTDPLQAEIFERLFAQGEHQLFFIGDPKQAIYGFRGADLKAYLRAARRTDRRFGLAVNWRSDALLLQGMNALFSGHERPFMEEEIRYRPVSAAPGREQGREAGAPLVMRRVQGDAKELGAEAGRKRVVADLVREVARRRVAYRFGEMAVLVRSHFQASEVQQALLARGIPAVRQTRESVLESEEAGQLEVVMEALAEPQAQGAVARALLTPLFADDAEADEEWVARFVEWRDAWRAEGWMAAWQRLLVECGGRRRVLHRARGERRLTNFLHLAELLHQEEAARKLGPESLLVAFRMLRETDEGRSEAAQLRLESDAEAVQVVTIHKSKGLEYPVVFAPFLWTSGSDRQGAVVQFHDDEGQLFLDLRGGNAPEEHLDRAAKERQAEELRLLYVAVTRARNCCVIYWGDFAGYGQSALGYLLPDAEAVERLAATVPGGVRAEVAEDRGDSVLLEAPAEERMRGARVFRRTLGRSAFTTSFTGLTRGAPSEAPEVDEAAEEALPEVELTPEGIHAFAKGARAGDLIHEVMEAVEFDPASAAERREVIAQRLARYGFDGSWLDALEATITAALERELEPGLRLGAIPRAERLAEVDFSCRLPRLGPDDLVALARRHPDELEEREVGRMQFAEVQGFLRGAIDLFFRHEGRYYLLDWKSNWLGRSAAAYTPARMAAAMREHHYGLQARLYTLAADQYLRLRVPGYDYERDFGGVFYFFLRGVESAEGGVVRLRPSAALVGSMREWMEVKR